MESQTTIPVIYYRKSNRLYSEALRILYNNDTQGVLTGVFTQEKKHSKKQSNLRVMLEQLLLVFLKGGLITEQKDETLMRIRDAWEEKINYSYKMPIQNIIEMRIESYLTLNDLIADMVRFVISKMSYEYEGYLTSLLYSSVTQIIQQLNIKIREQMRRDFKGLIKVIDEFRIERQYIPKSMNDFRQIREIYEYRYYSENKALITSSIKPVICPDNCTCKCPQSTVPCQNIQKKLRCSKECQCQNFPIRPDIQQFMDVEEYIQAVPVWGFPYYTKKNIFFCLIGSEDELELKEHFMNVTIPKAMNQLKLDGHSMKQVMEFILNCQDKYLQFSPYDKMQAQQLLKAIEYDKDHQAFQIFSKGLGLISVNPYNFQVGDLIGVYLAETYSSDIWFERQDLFKQLTSRAYSDELFNMTLQRLPEEEEYPNKTVILDPIRYGNQLCRLSHSCQPNLKSEVVISNGCYYIVFVAIRNIFYGEELTFNYTSIKTDNSDDNKDYCFCGFCEAGTKYIHKCEWRKAIKNWEPTCLSFIINACETTQINGQENWLDAWIELVRERFMQISDLNTRQVMLDNMNQTYSRMKYYQDKQSQAYRYAHPLRRASLKEVQKFSYYQMCELFIGSEDKEGELHMIAKYLKTEAYHCLKVVDQYRFLIRQIMSRGNYQQAGAEIKLLLQYLAIQLRSANSKLAQMLAQRSFIKTIFVFNQFPMIQGDEFQKTFFRCHKEMFKDYDQLDKKLKFTYDQHFLIRAALDITLDSNLKAIKKLYKFNFIFRSTDRYPDNSYREVEGFNKLFKRHAKLLMNKRYFYAYEVDADDRDSDLDSSTICEKVESHLQATVRKKQIEIKEEVAYREDLVPMIPGLLPTLQQSEESTLDEEQFQPEKKQNYDDVFRVKAEVKSEKKPDPNVQPESHPQIKTEVCEDREMMMLTTNKQNCPIKIEVKSEVVNEPIFETVSFNPNDRIVISNIEDEKLSQRQSIPVKTEPTENGNQNHLKYNRQKLEGSYKAWLKRNSAENYQSEECAKQRQILKAYQPNYQSNTKRDY